jgi:pimeloyl-ACP methyl ester carboxylesterase
MSTDIGNQLSRTHELATRITAVHEKRRRLAQERFEARLRKAVEEQAALLEAQPAAPWDLWTNWVDYSTDLAQRSVLFWDALRERGNQFLQRQAAGNPPVLHFAYETLMDGRTFERPVNYALVRIVPPAGVTVDPKRRPYMIIDPRAGHGPGIGGFKDDSQVGAALQAGHPVYFVIFFPQPEPGQTLLDVCAAEQQFVRKVRTLHPESPKPALVGNCQGGWAAMMLASAGPDDAGPIVINGSPMSYWGGAWSEGEGDNPMRYAGGLLGGTWLASLFADLGNGMFDGAHLVQNFEHLDPANTYWDKYYHLFANADTEPPRFLDFERWWGGYYLLNREEIEWITRNLFVGNQLWSGEATADTGRLFDLREIKSPIILFASMGDNITPPQQAFNWVADVYGSTDEIKARGQVIVGLLHQDVGHLGIFVSGRVAKKEHKQIVAVMESIESLPPGLYGMQIAEHESADGKPEYEVSFVERTLEEVTARLNRFKRADEQPFEAVAAVSEFNQRAYELFAQPLVQALSNDYTARLGRELHPLRASRWAFSDLNPWLQWLAPAASWVRSQRKAAGADQPLRSGERIASEMISASLDYYRDLRDAASEAVFFGVYGNLFGLYMADERAAAGQGAAAAGNPRDLPVAQEALAAMSQGGYAEAVARAAHLLQRKGRPLPLAWLESGHEFAGEYADLLPRMTRDEARRIRGRQEIIVKYELERALETLPALLADARDRERLLLLLERILADRRVQRMDPSPEQLAMLARIRSVLGTGGAKRLVAA